MFGFAQRSKPERTVSPKSMVLRRADLDVGHEMNAVRHADSEEPKSRLSSTVSSGFGRDLSQIPIHTPAKEGTATDGLTAFSEKRRARAFSSSQHVHVNGFIPRPFDPIHGPILDQYSQETGLPRDAVSQHDPGYEAWLAGRPRVPPLINITLDMPVPAVPPPNYSRDQNQLGAWEKADFHFSPRLWSICDHVITNGVESSFVTDVTIELTQPGFEYFIASHIYENMNDFGRDLSERNTWRMIHNRILQHASVHFTRYRQVIDMMRQEFMRRFAALPTRNHPIRIPQQELETYMNNLLLYLIATLRHKLWKVTCDWEHADYPNLLRGIPNVYARFRPACDPPPQIPPEPTMPIVITPGDPRRRLPGTPPGRTR